MNPPRNDEGMEVPEPPEYDLHSLVSAYLGEQLSGDQWEYLNGRKDDPEFWGEWQDVLKTEQALMILLDDPVEEVPSSVAANGGGRENKNRKWFPRIVLGAAAVIALVVSLKLMMGPSKSGEPDGGILAEAGSGDDFRIAAFSLANCRWNSEQDRFYPGDNLVGQRIKLKSGVMKITFSSGRLVLLSGKVDAIFKAREAGGIQLDLECGELAVIGGNHEAADGDEFFVRTPKGLLEEIGTEFVVQVGGEGEVRVTVESGKVGVQGEEDFTLGARQSAYLGHNGVTREDRSFNSAEQKLFDRMPDTKAGLANVVHYHREEMGSDLYRIIDPDSLLLVQERQNVLLEKGIRYNIDQPGTYPFYREGEEFRPPGWKMPETDLRDKGARVDSYLIQYNPSREQLEDMQVYGYIDFDQPVLGILTGGYKLNHWDEVFGIPGVTYWKSSWPFPKLVRGLESTSLSGGVANIADVLTLSEDRKRLTIRLCASLRLDQIRVLLKASGEK